MNSDTLGLIVHDIEERLASDNHPPGYFDCVEMLDVLEFHVLDFANQNYTNSEIRQIEQQAKQLHAILTSIMNTTLDKLIQEIHTPYTVPPLLKQIIAEYQAAPNKLLVDEAGYDMFDDFLTHLFQVDFVPSETRMRTADMIYLQPAPGRIILDIIDKLTFTEQDCFYDLGSGLGQVSILISLLTPARAVGIEYEPTYVNYADLCVQKLGNLAVEFRNQDVRESDFSDGTIFFLHTPFMGSILQQVLECLREVSQKHPIILCTYGPCTPIIEQETWLVPINTSHSTSEGLAILTSATL